MSTPPRLPSKDPDSPGAVAAALDALLAGGEERDMIRVAYTIFERATPWPGDRASYERVSGTFLDALVRTSVVADADRRRIQLLWMPLRFRPLPAS